MPGPNDVTAATVLAAIKQMSSRQKYTPQPISLDTLMLALNISLQELTPLIEELRMSRDIVFHPPRVTTPVSNKIKGSVSLT